MKELSIEEKAKAYDEIIKKANKMHHENCEACQMCIEELIPELKESEDERIRKEILSFCQNRADNYPNDPKYANIGKWIAWLEKQGEHANFRNKIQIGDKVTRNEDGVLVNLSQLNRVAKPADVVESEKQGKQDMIPLNKVIKFLDEQLVNDKDEVTGEPFINFQNYGAFKETFISLFKRKMLEKQGEKKLNVNDNAKEMFIKALERVEEQNAKGYKLTDCDKNSWWEDFKAYTTSKQILANSAKTCKDEQNPAWSDENENLFRCAIDAVKQESKVRADGCLDKGVGKRVINLLKSLKERVQTQPKQEWSEEDKEFINDLIGIFDGQQYQAHSDEEIVKWLKSIRLPYNKEWDENDEEMLKSIIATCELACEDRDSSPAKHLLEMQTNWLKSLRPQSTWKPSNEQMEALNDVISSRDIKYDILSELWNDLKKLKEE